MTRPSIFIRINGTEFEIPYEIYAGDGPGFNSTSAAAGSTPGSSSGPSSTTSTRRPSSTPGDGTSGGGGGGSGSSDGGAGAGGDGQRDICALSLKSAPSLFLLGNVFLRTVVAIHDLGSKPARMGFAKRNPAYVPRRRRRSLEGDEMAGTTAFTSMPLYAAHRASHAGHRALDNKLSQGWSNATRIKVEELEGIQYMTYISVGTPRQHCRFLISLSCAGRGCAVERQSSFPFICSARLHYL